MKKILAMKSIFGLAIHNTVYSHDITMSKKEPDKYRVKSIPDHLWHRWQVMEQQRALLFQQVFEYEKNRNGKKKN